MHPSAPPARGLPALAILLTLAALAAALVAAPPRARANTTYQSLPFSQDWSDAALITANDNWAGVPGIVGYLGDGLTSTTSTDPQTILGPGSGAVDVIANQSSITLIDGGVAEFDGIANPTIALQGSNSADAPNLVLYLNTTGFQNINVRYNVRDIDSTADNVTTQVALQYRVGSSGNFINVPGGGYIFDATTGPNLATLVTPINVTLDAAVNDKPQVEVRIITTNAPNDDEWVGIDDISVTGTAIGAPQDFAPNVESIAPANGASTFAETNITVTFSEAVTAPADGMTLTCNGAPVAFAGLPVVAPGASQIVLDPAASLPLGASCTVTVVAAKIRDVDQTPTPMVSDQSATFTVAASVCPAGDALTKISAVQGAGAATTLPGDPVTVQGVVTALFSGFSGFFMQEEAADHDASAATSEGIFVFTGNSGLPAGVAVGDVVRVTGRPGEFSTTASNTMTQLAQPTVLDCGTSATVAPVDVTLPVTALSDLERYEGMLVRLPQELTISEYFNFDRFGEYTLAKPRDGEARLITPTQAEEPGAAAVARADENLRRRIVVDDGRNSQNPDPAIHPNGEAFTLQNRFRGGDTVAGLQGILAQQLGTYRIQPTAYGTYTPRNPRPIASQAVGGTLRVGSMNALNYFLTPDYPSGNPLDETCGPQQDLECRGHDSDQPQELARQRDKLVAAITLLDPDILGLIEIENTPGVSPLADLVAALNADLGAGTFAHVDTGVIGSDAIRVGLIYRPAKATPAGAFQWLTGADDQRFLDELNRPVLAQSFTEVATGEKLTVAVAHLKSKGSDCNAVNDPDAGDGQGNCNLTRRDAALALVDWLATDPTGSGSANVLIVGDLNSYAREDPIDAVVAGPDGAAGTADDYTNLIARYQGADAYSYVFDAQVGYLDHALASAALTPFITGANEPHINADEPDLLDYDTSFKLAAQDAFYEPNAYRASDHDPIIVGVDLGAPGPDPGDPGPGPVDPGGPGPGPDPSDPDDPARLRLWLPLLRR